MLTIFGLLGLNFGYSLSSAAASTEICQDTLDILDDWEELLEVTRMSKTFNDDKIAVETWTSVGTFLGDWQPVSGSTMRNEAGLSIKSEAQIIGPCDADVQEDDKIYRTNGSFMYVNYVRHYEDHKTIYLKKTGGSN
jgi:hypothetical protein